jgi:hypothetical protein
LVGASLAMYDARPLVSIRGKPDRVRPR